MKEKKHLNKWHEKSIEQNLTLWEVAHDLDEVDKKINIHHSKNIKESILQNSSIQKIFNFFRKALR